MSLTAITRSGESAWTEDYEENPPSQQPTRPYSSEEIQVANLWKALQENPSESVKESAEKSLEKFLIRKPETCQVIPLDHALRRRAESLTETYQKILLKLSKASRNDQTLWLPLPSVFGTYSDGPQKELQEFVEENPAFFEEAQVWLPKAGCTSLIRRASN